MSANPWINHVRVFAKQNKIAYGCAISDPECIASYNRQGREQMGMGSEDRNVNKRTIKRKVKPAMKSANTGSASASGYLPEYKTIKRKVKPAMSSANTGSASASGYLVKKTKINQFFKKA